MATGFTTAISTGIAALGAAMTAGVFFAFSTLVMPALDRMPSPQAISAMQEINRIAVRSALMPLMFGPAILCLLVAIASLRADRAVAAGNLAGTAFYLVGVVGVTICANVPLNDGLASLSATTAPPHAWQSYSAPWTMWNSLRAAAGAIASGCFMTALWLLGRSAS